MSSRSNSQTEFNGCEKFVSPASCGVPGHLPEPVFKEWSQINVYLYAEKGTMTVAPCLGSEHIETRQDTCNQDSQRVN